MAVLTGYLCPSIISSHIFKYLPFPDEDDFVPVSTSLRFSECENRSCAEIEIVFDNEIEDTETFDITLEKTIGLDRRIILGAVDGYVSILDVPSKWRNKVYRQLYNITLIFQRGWLV